MAPSNGFAIWMKQSKVGAFNFNLALIEWFTARKICVHRPIRLTKTLESIQTKQQQ